MMMAKMGYHEHFKLVFGKVTSVQGRIQHNCLALQLLVLQSQEGQVLH